MKRYTPTMEDLGSAARQSDKLGQEVRAYVRDRFTPGNLESLNELERFVSAKVRTTIMNELRMQGASWVDRIQ